MRQAIVRGIDESAKATNDYQFLSGVPMTPRAVLPLEYVEQVSPWPRILKLLGVFTLLYGGINISMGSHFFRTLWVLRQNPRFGMPPRDFWITISSSIIQLLLGAMLVLGGVQMLRNHSYRFVRLSLRMMLAIWGLGCVVGPSLQPAYWQTPIVFDQLFYLMIFLAFPLLGILLLRQFKLSEDTATSSLVAQEGSPWPRILRNVAQITLVLAIGRLGWTTRGLMWTFNPPAPPPGAARWASQSWDTFRATRAVLAIFETLVTLVMLISAAVFFKRSQGVKGMIFAAKCWLLLWILGVVTNIFSHRASALEYLADNAIVIVFPLILLLILREYLTQHSEPSAVLATPLPGSS